MNQTQDLVGLVLPFLPLGALATWIITQRAELPEAPPWVSWILVAFATATVGNAGWWLIQGTLKLRPPG